MSVTWPGGLRNADFGTLFAISSRTGHKHVHMYRIVYVPSVVAVLFLAYTVLIITLGRTRMCLLRTLQHSNHPSRRLLKLRCYSAQKDMVADVLERTAKIRLVR